MFSRRPSLPELPRADFRRRFLPALIAFGIHAGNWRALAFLTLLLAASPLSAPVAGTAQDAAQAALEPHAVILIYHRFGEDDVPVTNIRVDQFAEHLRILKEGGYHVLPLTAVVAALRARQSLPDRTVAITVDDAWRSFAEVGWPMLKQAGFPVTLFVSTDAADRGGHRLLDWNDIRRLHREGVALGHHGAAHLHMIAEGVESSRADLERADARWRAEFGAVPKVFAYPYGEYDPTLIELAKKRGFVAALAQFSSVASPAEDLFALPRFAFNEHYGDPARFRLVSQALALPVAKIRPSDPVLGREANPPRFGFSLTRPVAGWQQVACYASATGRAEVILLKEERRVEVRLPAPFPPGRQRINCTLPAGGGRWFWFGRFFYVPGGPLD
ncbi:MAG: chitin deacetylase [Alphaproteobacteria bacterium]|nr:MAG: chitin deacetylase [Alphaproteobacteria bacterium]